MIEVRYRLILISIAPPENDCGCRIVVYRHLEERKAFDYIVATREKWVVKRKPEVILRLPYFLHRLEKSRFGPYLSKWLRDYENLVWPYSVKPELERAIQDFRPHAILNLADPSLSPIALSAARRYKLPLIGMFNDWFPIMPAHYGNHWTCSILSKRYRQFYKACDLAFCTSDGMKEELGPHPNSHVIYPMPGKHNIPNEIWPPKNNKFRLVYVGSAQGFYGRMLCELLMTIQYYPEIEIKIVTPANDWPVDIYKRAQDDGSYLGFMPPQEAAKVIASADALLVVMSFDQEHELFMRTSFTTKFLDYTAFGKPIIIWAPNYCSVARFVNIHGGAINVNSKNPQNVFEKLGEIIQKEQLRHELIKQAKKLYNDHFNRNRLQSIFIDEIEKVIKNNIYEKD